MTSIFVTCVFLLLYHRVDYSSLQKIGTFTEQDVWSGKLWNVVQESRGQFQSSSDALMQHIWHRPDQADRFVDCDILADSQTDKQFMFVNLDDMHDKRDEMLAKLPDDAYVLSPWPLDKVDFMSIPYRFDKDILKEERLMFKDAVDIWESAVNVNFYELKTGKEPVGNHLQVTHGGGCFATLGYHATDARQLSLEEKRCKSVITHLLGHVLGLPHPTSTVGRSSEYYLMPHHAAPRTFGVWRSRVGELTNPNDIMAVDPWFCGVFNRSTWRVRSPLRYVDMALTGAWYLMDKQRLMHAVKHSPSVMLLQKQIRTDASINGLRSDPKCEKNVTLFDKKCSQAVDASCGSMAPDRDYISRLIPQELCVNKKLKYKKTANGDILLMNLLYLNSVCVFFTTSEEALGQAADCWQCAVVVFTINADSLFGSGKYYGSKEGVYSDEDMKQFRLIALASRCSFFVVEANGVLEEAWYRACTHHLLDTDGVLTFAWRGPGTVLLRYTGYGVQMSPFHMAFLNQVGINWRIVADAGCDCSRDSPSSRVQHTVERL